MRFDKIFDLTAGVYFYFILYTVSDFPHVELKKYFLWYTQEMKRLGCTDTSAGMSGRRAIPPFQGGRVF